MKKHFIIILFVFVVFTTYSQSSKQRVGVLDFAANNLSKSEALIVGEIFTSELVISGKFDVVDRKNIESLMAEMEFQMSGCTDSSCAVEIGQILSLDYMMYGSINKLGESFIINIYMINVGTAQIEKTAKERFKTIEQSYDVMPAVIGKLIEKNSVVITEVSPPANNTIPPKIAIKPIATKPPFSHHIVELGVGYISGARETGFEFEGLYKFMPIRFFGFGGGISLGYGGGVVSHSTGEYITGIRIGMTFEIYFQFGKLLGISFGMKGAPKYVDEFIGTAVALYIGKWYTRFAINTMNMDSMEPPGIIIGVGKCYKW